LLHSGREQSQDNFLFDGDCDDGSLKRLKGRSVRSRAAFLLASVRPIIIVNCLVEESQWQMKVLP
jgi:hypothetical protein